MSFIYLASPYTDDNEKTQTLRAFAAAQVAAILMEQGFVVYSPIVHGVSLQRFMTELHDNDWWMKQCYAFLRRSERLFVLCIPGWQESRGVRLEIRAAELLGMDIEFVNPDGTLLGGPPCA